MKAKELRELNEKELRAKLHELKENLFNLRFQKSMGNISSPAEFKRVRRDIARVLTVMKEKGIKI
jgi:large subunit ribosomal protein L29|uniref:Large ribosomal subunit protein uL29 n=1 Tax=candidate division WOR-3 bacterium TaxID=2052148 RepID=A0A7C4Y682_UNCW3